MTAVRAYVWAAIPAALAGLLFAVLVVRDWPSGYGIAGMAGVIGLMIAVIIFPIPDGGLLVYAAVLAGFIAIACRAVLERAGVINPQGDA